ncbi:MAG: carboxypeptidase regulatory-like domain-containing protein [Blastocatellia bacterium]
MKKVVTASLILLSLLANLTAFARDGEGEPQAMVELRGTVIDEQNAYIPAATITLDDGKGNHYTATSDERGQYHVQVKPSLYTVTVEVEGFAKFIEQVDLGRRRKEDFNIKLQVAISEQVEVQDNAAGISTDPDRNLSAVTLTEKDLEALPDDPDDLLSTLKQMAGAAGGSDDAMVYVDGFHERGQIPPKEAILRISINQNPFAAEYQEPGNARIEIITKPGADTYHGSFRFNFGDESLNARNPIFPDKPAFQMRNFAFNFTGPIIHNRWGFFADFDRRFTFNNSLINATVLDPVTHAAVPFIQSILAPSRQTMFSVRTDFMATKKHTFGVQYRFNDSEATNQGLDNYNLPDRGFNRNSHEDTLRFSMTSILSEHMVNEARIQLSRRTNGSISLSDASVINVLDAFTAGGANIFADNKNENLDFTNNVSYTWKSHTFKAGFRAESERYTNLNQSNFAGTFTFSGNPVTGETSLDIYRRAIEGDPAARPSQFSINRGDPFIGFSQWQFGSFMQDDWKVSPRLTLSFGLRNEFQTHLQDKLNFAPRFGLAWQADKAKKSTVRAGAGIFFAGLDDSITSETIRLDGFHQQQFTVINPDFFPNIPAVLVAGTSSRLPTIRIKSEDLNDPYSIISTVSYERQLPWKLMGSVGYKWTRGVHLLRSRNINAPELINSQFVSPFPGEGPILQYESTGLSTRNEFNFFLRTGFSRTLTFFGGYTLSWTKSNTDGAGTMPANPYDLTTEWGRASNDSRHNIFFGGSLLTRWDIRLNPMVIYRSTRPFNIITGTDLNRDLSFSDRPSFAQAGDPVIVHTRFGDFNPAPLPGEEIIPRNFGDGPSFVMVNLNISKTIGFGPAPNNYGQGNGQGNNRAGNRGGGAPRGGGARGGFGGFGGAGGPMGGFFGGDSRHKYNLTIGLNMSNVLNHTNLINYTGNLSSPFFGIATQAMNGRRIEAQLRFSF